MSERSAWVSSGTELVKKNLPVRPLKEGWVRVKPTAVALNPTDYKHLKNKGADGTVTGHDFAGVIVELGSNVTEYKVGDTVAGGLAGFNVAEPEDGAFSEVIDVPPFTLFKLSGLTKSPEGSAIPAGPTKTFEQAASLGIGIDTAALAFVHYNNTPLVKNSKSGYALIYGAASSLGYQAAQIAKWLGYTVIAVASKKHFSLFDAIGVSHLVDYHDSDWIAQVKKIGGEDIIYAYDTISQPDTFPQVYEAVSSTKPAKINASLGVSPPKQLKSNVEYDSPLYYFLWQDKKSFGANTSPGNPEIIKKRQEIFRQINALLDDQLLYSLPITIVGEGFDKIPALFDHYGQKGASGEKLVVRL